MFQNELFSSREVIKRWFTGEKSTLYNVQHTPTELKNARCLALVMLLRAKRLETSYRDSAKHSGEAPISPSFHNTPHTHTHTPSSRARAVAMATQVSLSRQQQLLGWEPTSRWRRREEHMRRRHPRGLTQHSRLWFSPSHLVPFTLSTSTQKDPSLWDWHNEEHPISSLSFP